MNPRNMFRLFAFIIVATLGFAGSAESAVTGFLSSGANCSGGATGSYSVGGGTFQVSLCVNTTTEPLCGNTVFLQSANAGENGRFQVTARTLGPTFPNTPSSPPFPFDINNPNTAGTLGGFNTVPQAAGSNQLIATFTLQPKAAATANSYVISTTPGIAGTSVEVDGGDGTCGVGLVTVTTPISASFTINLSAATTSISSGAPPAGTVNTAYSHTFVANGSPAPTFAVTAGTIPTGMATLTAGGVLAGTPTASGTFNFTVTATNPTGSASQVVALVIAAAAQTITFNNPGAQAFSASPFTSGATASSALPVTLTSTTPAVCTITPANSLNITFVTAGSCTINANQAGGSGFGAAPQVQQTFAITTVAPGAPSVSGAAGNLQGTLTITPPANTGGVAVGTLTYAASCVPVGGTDAQTGTTSLSHVITGLTNGVNYTCTVIATNSFGPGPASAASNVFQPAATPVTPSFTSVATLAGTVGTAIPTFNITANGVPTPTISAGAAPSNLVFTSGGANVGTGTITGTPNAAGSFNFVLTATSVGAPTPVVQQNLVITIAKGNQTITFAAQTTPSRPFVAAGTFAIAPVATTTAAGLTITYVSATPAVCTVAGTTVTIVSGGTCTINATQAGDANFNAATTVPQSVTITPAAQTITFGALPGRLFSTTPQAISPPATASSGLAIAYTSTTPLVCTVSGATFTPVAVGNCTIAADQAGNANFTAAAQVTQTFAIGQGTQVITFNGLVNQPLGTPPINVSATSSSGLPVTVTSTTPIVCTSSGVNGTTITLLILGTCTLQGAQVGNANFLPATPTTASFTVIVPGAVTLTSSANPSLYRSALLLTATVSGTNPTGSVSFVIVTGAGQVSICATVPLVAATATCPVPANLNTISGTTYIASYSGDANNPSNTTSYVQLVNTSSVQLSVVATPNQPVVGATTVLRATLAGLSLTNKVTFNENGTALPGCGAVTIAPLPGATDIGVAACTVTSITAGLHNYVVTYPHATDAGFEQVTVPVTPLVAAASDYTDMWWVGPTENGWGVSITQHGRAQFIVLYVYDNNGNPIWYVLPEGTWNASNTAFTGALYQPTSSPFSSYTVATFKPLGVAGGPVGTATVTYTGANTATLTYTINGVSGSKPIIRQAFATDDGQAKMQVNDLWWAGIQQNGWGLNIAQQGRVLFPVWYTYDSAGRTVFYSVPGGTWTGSSFKGDIYSTVSSAWLGVNYNPAQFVVTKVGTMTLDFSDQSNAVMTYTINSLTQSKAISRLAF